MDCPVGGKFGDEFNLFEECDSCDFLEECKVKAEHSKLVEEMKQDREGRYLKSIKEKIRQMREEVPEPPPGKCKIPYDAVMTNAKTKLGPKQIDGKARFDLIPPQCLFELAKIYNIGCEIKYPKKSWEQGLIWGEVYGQIHRHITSWMGGETYDPEDGLHHLAHAAWACFTLMHFEWTETGVDDRTLWIDKNYKKTFSKEDYRAIQALETFDTLLEKITNSEAFAKGEVIKGTKNES